MLFGFLIALPTLFWKVYGPRTTSHHAMSALCIGSIAAYAFLQGAWPIGLVELASAAIAFGPLWPTSSGRLTAGRPNRISSFFGRRDIPSVHPVTPPYLGGRDPMAVCNN